MENGFYEQRHDYRLPFLLLWLGYVGYYLGRANLALALPALLQQYEIPYTLAGIIATVGYICYALGQPVHGILIDRFGAKSFFLLGLIVSSIANLTMGFVTSPIWMMAIWGINGFFQACGWPALLKIAGAWLPVQGKGRLMSLLATSAHFGSIFSWITASFVLIKFGWRYVFWLPAVVTGIVAVINALFLQEQPHGLDLGEPSHTLSRPSFFEQVKQIVMHPQIRWTAFILACVNFIYNAVLAWLPTFLVDGGFALANMGLRSVIFPLTNVVGALTVGRLIDARGLNRQAHVLVAVQIGLVLALTGLFSTQVRSFWGLLSLAVVGLCIAGANFLVTGPIPLMISLGSSRAFTVGVINGFGYIGASLGSFLTGVLVEASGWTAAVRLWLIIGVLALAGALRSAKIMSR